LGQNLSEFFRFFLKEIASINVFLLKSVAGEATRGKQKLLALPADALILKSIPVNKTAEVVILARLETSSVTQCPFQRYHVYASYHL